MNEQGPTSIIRTTLEEECCSRRPNQQAIEGSPMDPMDGSGLVAEVALSKLIGVWSSYIYL